MGRGRNPHHKSSKKKNKKKSSMQFVFQMKTFIYVYCLFFSLQPYTVDSTISLLVLLSVQHIRNGTTQWGTTNIEREKVCDFAFFLKHLLQVKFYENRRAGKKHRFCLPQEIKGKNEGLNSSSFLTFSNISKWHNSHHSLLFECSSISVSTCLHWHVLLNLIWMG